jgi:hypothetical protein
LRSYGDAKGAPDVIESDTFCLVPTRFRTGLSPIDEHPGSLYPIDSFD